MPRRRTRVEPVHTFNQQEPIYVEIPETAEEPVPFGVDPAAPGGDISVFSRTEIPPEREGDPRFIPIRQPGIYSGIPTRPGQRAFIERTDGTRIEILGPNMIEARLGDRLIVEELPSNATEVDEGPPETSYAAGRSEQLSLVPEHELTHHLANLPVTEIRPGVLPHGEPSETFVESVRQFGVLQPIAVVALSPSAETGDSHDRAGHGHGWAIADGRRRLAAARATGRAYIPAMIFPAGTPAHLAHSMALVANLHRRPNPASELAAVEELARAGFPPERIALDLRLSLTVVQARMRLASLPEALRAALADGRMALSVAERAARLPERGLQRLVDVLDEAGRVTGADVAATRQFLSEMGQVSIGIDTASLTEATRDATEAIQNFSRAIGATAGTAQTYTVQGFVPPDDAAVRILQGADVRQDVIQMRIGDGPPMPVRVVGRQQNTQGEWAFDLEAVSEALYSGVWLQLPGGPDRPTLLTFHDLLTDAGVEEVVAGLLELMTTMFGFRLEPDVSDPLNWGPEPGTLRNWEWLRGWLSAEHHPRMEHLVSTRIREETRSGSTDRVHVGGWELLGAALSETAMPPLPLTRQAWNGTINNRSRRLTWPGSYFVATAGPLAQHVVLISNPGLPFYVGRNEQITVRVMREIASVECVSGMGTWTRLIALLPDELRNRLRHRYAAELIQQGVETHTAPLTYLLQFADIPLPRIPQNPFARTVRAPEQLPPPVPQTAADRPHRETVDGREYLIWEGRRWVRQDQVAEHPDIDLLRAGRLRYRGQVYALSGSEAASTAVRRLSTARIEYESRRYVLEEVYNRDVSAARESGRSERAPRQPQAMSNNRLSWDGTTYVATSVAERERDAARAAGVEEGRLAERTRVAEEALTSRRRGQPVTRAWFAETFRRVAGQRGNQGWEACLRRIAGAIDTIPASPDDESDALFQELAQVMAMAERISRRSVVNAE